MQCNHLGRGGFPDDEVVVEAVAVEDVVLVEGPLTKKKKNFKAF